MKPEIEAGMGFSAPTRAEREQDRRKRIKAMEKRIRELEAEVDNLRTIVKTSMHLLYHDSCEYDDVRTYIDMANLATISGFITNPHNLDVSKSWIDLPTCAAIFFLLKYSPDNPELLPKGKEEMMQRLEELIENAIKPFDRGAEHE